MVTPGVTQSSEVKEVDRLRCDVTWGSVMCALMYASVFCGVSGVVESSLSALSGEIVLGVGSELDSIVLVGICLSFCPFLCVIFVDGWVAVPSAVVMSDSAMSAKVNNPR